jgi:hypothetical protein
MSRRRTVKLAATIILLFLAVLGTWTFIDWRYVHAPHDKKPSDWALVVLAVYPITAGFATARAMKSMRLAWRISGGILAFVAFSALSVAALMTIGLQIHFWLGGRL